MVKKSSLVILVLLMATQVWGAQVTANFIVPFDPVTRQTILPVDKNGQQVKMDWWHVTREKGSTVVVQVRAEQIVVDAMKADSKYFLLEDKPVDPATPAVIGVSAVEAKAFLGKTMTTADINKQVWTTPEKSVEAVVKLHGATLADYKGSGLGVLPVTGNFGVEVCLLYTSPSPRD